ncbi:MAG: hypothetical protein Q9181_004997 [Wetmoreana brouardii]
MLKPTALRPSNSQVINLLDEEDLPETTEAGASRSPGTTIKADHPSSRIPIGPQPDGIARDISVFILPLNSSRQQSSLAPEAAATERCLERGGIATLAKDVGAQGRTIPSREVKQVNGAGTSRKESCTPQQLVVIDITGEPVARAFGSPAIKRSRFNGIYSHIIEQGRQALTPFSKPLAQKPTTTTRGHKNVDMEKAKKTYAHPDKQHFAQALPPHPETIDITEDSTSFSKSLTDSCRSTSASATKDLEQTEDGNNARNNTPPRDSSRGGERARSISNLIDLTIDASGFERDFSSDDVGAKLPKSAVPQPPLVNQIEEDQVLEPEIEDLTQEAQETWLEGQGRRRQRTGRYGRFRPSSTENLPKAPTRNLAIENPFRKLSTYNHNGIPLRENLDVEFQDRGLISKLNPVEAEIPSYNSFMRIREIVEDTRNQTVTLRGWLFERTKYLNGMLDKKLNEVCWILHEDEGDDRDIKVQAMVTISVTDVIRRRKIRLTNQHWPRLSYFDDLNGTEDSKDVIHDERLLVCRWKYIHFYRGVDQRVLKYWSERRLEVLSKADCDKRDGANGEPCALEATQLRQSWRGETILGGSSYSDGNAQIQRQRSGHPASEEPVDLTQDDPDAITTSTGKRPRRYSYPRVTNMAFRMDWVTRDGIKCHSINRFEPKGSSLNATVLSPPNKRQRLNTLEAIEERQQPSMRTDRESVEMLRPEPPCRLNRPYPRRHQTSNISSNSSLSKRQKYTFGDSFCGAGGMSRAAHQTDLKIKWAFDHNKHACTSYEMNFPDASLHSVSADEFIRDGSDCKIDIAHFSPPCQYFSPAHTVQGKDDETNTASLFAIGDLLKKSRPRIATLEQTAGLVLTPQHEGYFNAVVRMFTSHGFSVRWHVLFCPDYGLPQERLRLFMIASCPGEALPPFPKPTHSDSPKTTRLLPWTTVNDALRSVPPGARNHEPAQCKPCQKEPYCGNTTVLTVTCNGNGLYHPSGLRNFTIREFATLQGFPVEHHFSDVETKKQVGNAVPPIVGSKVLGRIVQALKKSDGVAHEG